MNKVRYKTQYRTENTLIRSIIVDLKKKNIDICIRLLENYQENIRIILTLLGWRKSSKVSYNMSHYINTGVSVCVYIYVCMCM